MEKNFKRTLLVTKETLNDLNNFKGRLKESYDGFGVYQEVCPSGCFVHQSYAICNDNVVIISECYNNNDFEDMLDIIDNYNESGKFGIKVFRRGTSNGKSVYIIHNGGNKMI